MTQIFLIRHAEAEGNMYRRVQGQSEQPLTARGREQAASLAPRFADMEITAVYSSDYARAEDTARGALGDRDIPIVRDKRLREMCFGVWEGLPWGEVAWRWPEQMAFFRGDASRWDVPGCESLAHTQERMLDFVLDMEKKHPGGNVVAAGHSTSIQALMARLHGIPFNDAVYPANTAVALLQVENGVCRVVYENDDSHLKAAPFVPVMGAYDLRFTRFDMTNGRERYLACYRDAWQVAHGSLTGFQAENCWRAAAARAAESPESLQAAWRREDFAGVLALDESRGAGRGLGWIAFCYIVPELRGHHCGIQLIGQAAARFRALGRRAMRLTVAPGNPALAFYRWAGFVPAGQEPGALEPLWVMEKTL